VVKQDSFGTEMDPGSTPSLCPDIESINNCLV